MTLSLTLGQMWEYLATQDSACVPKKFNFFCLTSDFASWQSKKCIANNLCSYPNFHVTIRSKEPLNLFPSSIVAELWLDKLIN